MTEQDGRLFHPAHIELDSLIANATIRLEACRRIRQRRQKRALTLLAWREFNRALELALRLQGVFLGDPDYLGRDLPYETQVDACCSAIEWLWANNLDLLTDLCLEAEPFQPDTVDRVESIRLHLANRFPAGFGEILLTYVHQAEDSSSE
jgi:hypothetical protein